MWNHTRNYSPEYLRSLYLGSMEFRKSLEKILTEIKDADQNLEIAISDACNVAKVLSCRAAEQLGLGEKF